MTRGSWFFERLGGGWRFMPAEGEPGSTLAVRRSRGLAPTEDRFPYEPRHVEPPAAMMDRVEIFDDAGSLSTADGLTRAVIALVGADGAVQVESPVDEFHTILRVTPRVAGAVAFDVMIGHEDPDAMPGSHGLVVVHAHLPRLGWWTFDDPTHVDGHLAAWAVIALLVDGGGQFVSERRFSSLFDARGDLVSGPNHNGGVEPRQRRSTFRSYRADREPPAETDR